MGQHRGSIESRRAAFFQPNRQASGTIGTDLNFEGLDLKSILEKLLSEGAPQIDSTQSLADSNRSFSNLRTQAAQNRITSGLSGTSIGSSENAGIERERVAAGNRIREGAQLSNIGLQSDFRQELLPLLEALGQQQEQSSFGLGQRRSKTKNFQGNQAFRSTFPTF